MKAIESIAGTGGNALGDPVELYLEERRRLILHELRTRGRASVAELSRNFGVSEVTIRTDLAALAARHLAVRTHGGAVPAPDSSLIPSLDTRRRERVAEKNRIGEKAAGLVVDGDAIILDSSSTTLVIAERLKSRRDLTVITNSLAIAQELLTTPGVTVVMPGGTLRRETASLTGSDGVHFLRKYHVRFGFFGAHGLTAAEGLTDVSPDEADLKRPLVGLCHEVIAVLDATKWGRVGVASFATLAQVNCVITDIGAPGALVTEVRGRGVEVITV